MLSPEPTAVAERRAVRRPERAPGGRRGSLLHLPQPLRKSLLALHVVVSVGWLGLDLGLLAFGLTGLATGDPGTLRAAYLGMEILAGTVLVPVALATVVTGIVLCLGTPWGLWRYHWVRIKLVITLAAATATILSLRPNIALAAGQVRAAEPAAGGLGEIGVELVAAPTVALTIYTVATVLSVLKPWGRTAYGRRKADATARRA